LNGWNDWNRLLHWMSNMPDMTRQKVAVGALHCFFLEIAFLVQKATSNLLNNAYVTLRCQIKKLPWSDNHLAGSFDDPMRSNFKSLLRIPENTVNDFRAQPSHCEFRAPSDFCIG